MFLPSVGLNIPNWLLMRRRRRASWGVCVEIRMFLWCPMTMFVFKPSNGMPIDESFLWIQQVSPNWKTSLHRTSSMISGMAYLGKSISSYPLLFLKKSLMVASPSYMLVLGFIVTSLVVKSFEPGGKGLSLFSFFNI